MKVTVEFEIETPDGMSNISKKIDLDFLPAAETYIHIMRHPLGHGNLELWFHGQAEKVGINLDQLEDGKPTGYIELSINDAGPFVHPSHWEKTKQALLQEGWQITSE